MAGIFETLKGWMGTLGGSSQADEERKKALLKFAEDHNLAGKPFSIGAVHDVRMKDPTSMYHRNGKDLSEVMFYDKGDGMNLYVGDVRGARDIYSGRIFNNVLTENGLNICNIDQLTPASQKAVLDQTAFKVCYQHMAGEGAEARAAAVNAVKECMIQPDLNSFKDSQINVIEAYLADYIPIGQQKVAAGALIAAADDIFKSSGNKEKHNSVLKEINGLVSETTLTGIKHSGKVWTGLLNSSEDFYKTPIHETRLAEAAHHAPLNDSDYAERELRAEAEANIKKTLHDRFEELMEQSEKEELGKGMKR